MPRETDQEEYDRKEQEKAADREAARAKVVGSRVEREDAIAEANEPLNQTPGRR